MLKGSFELSGFATIEREQMGCPFGKCRMKREPEPSADRADIAVGTVRKAGIVAVLGTVTLSGPLAIHFFLPAVPLLKQEFGVSSATAQAAFSVTLLVMAFATLVYGSISDRLGRRAVLIGGLVVFIAGSTLCALSDGIAGLIVGRLLQAVGAACGLVLARAIAHDIFGTEGAVRIFAYLTMAYSLGPMIAPPIGGVLVDGIGWRAIFTVAALAVALILVLVIFVLPAGGRPTALSSVPRLSLLRGYVRLFGSLRFSGFVFQSGFGSGAFYAHAAAATFLMNEMLNRPASEFGFYFVLLPIGYWLGTLVAGRLDGRVAIEAMVTVGAAMTFLAAVVLAATVLLSRLTPLTLFVPGFFLTLGQGMALPNALAGAIGIDRSLAGTAAGIGIFLQLLIGAASSQLTGFVGDGTAFPMISVVLGAATLEMMATGLVWLARPGGTISRHQIK